MSNFITNEPTKDLRKRLIELISRSDELKFLVGFFYFSGIRELYDGLKANPDLTIKVLVGLSVDKTNFGILEVSDKVQLSDEEKTELFFGSIKKSLNTDYFDTNEFYEQIGFFIELIRQERLLIRKTEEPNHAKLYIFKLDESQIFRRNLFITGSSNLTKAGLTTQKEFNVEIGDYGFEDAEKYFDELWERAVKITEFAECKKKLVEVIQEGTLVRDVTPFEAFVLILKTYLDAYDQKDVGDSLINILEKNGYHPYKYQLDAVKQAVSIIENHNGVIIADVVGLGKTIVACAVAKQLRKRGIVICPPGLIGDRNKKSGWLRYLEEFGLYDWEVRSVGDLENTLEFLNSANDFEVIIVDEAHRFRNQDTLLYEKLKNICREKQVMLLTATPFNNRPSDILSLLKLFIIPKESSITLRSDLVDQFRSYGSLFDKLGFIKKYHDSKKGDKKKRAQMFYEKMFGDSSIDINKVSEKSKQLAVQIRNVMEPVTIRRNRLDLQLNPFYQDEIKKLSVVKDPLEWFFELTPEQSEFYDKVIELYFAAPEDGGIFKGAIYRPFIYEKGLLKKEIELEDEADSKLSMEDNRQFQQQSNLHDFMRRLVVKRFESSFGSFRQSLKNFKKINTICKEFVEKTGEYILDRDLLDKIYTMSIEEIEAHLLQYEEKVNRGEYPKNHKRYKLKDFVCKEEFIADIDSDLKMFDDILNELTVLELIKKDPKTACLLDNIEKICQEKPKRGEPKRKIVIFSEYLDTVEYLRIALQKVYGNRMLVVAKTLSDSTIKSINENFDASEKKKKDDYDILLSSDKISEGFNLNRAGIVINYDIPWNPVRVIQRLGRINRIGKKVFEELYIVNFFPTIKGSDIVKSREIAAIKMFLIHTALGEDAKIFDNDEEPTPSGLYRRVQQNPDNLEAESFYTKVLRKYLEIENKHPQLIEILKDFPPRVKVAKRGEQNELLVFFKKGRLYVSRASTEDKKSKPEYTSLEEVYDRIVCSPEEERLNWNSEDFWQAYSKIKNYKELNTSPLNEQSIEMKALNNLDFLLSQRSEKLFPYKSFLRMLRIDIVSYGTLPDYTLRRIMNLKEGKIKEIDEISSELVSDYLTKELERHKDHKKEIIIAIENKKL